MATDVAITTEDNATPYALMIAAVLDRAATARGLGKTLAGLEGIYSYRSPSDGQAATIRFAKGAIRVERGVARDSETVVNHELSRFRDPTNAKPDVKGSRRLSVSAGKILETTGDTWQEEAALFWPAVFTDPAVPRPVTVTASDQQVSEIYGASDGGAPFELIGPSYRLLALFAGFTALGQEIRSGDVAVVGGGDHTAALARASLSWMLGDHRGAPELRA